MNVKDKTQHALAKAALLSAALTGIKLVAYFLTGSMLVLGSFFDSLADTITSLVNRYIQKVSRKEPDSEHPFGHGGLEVIGALIQGVLIASFGIGLMIESWHKLMDGDTDYFEFDDLKLAIIIMGISAIGSFLIQTYLGRKLREVKEEKMRSLALATDRLHYVGDALTNTLGAIGLVIIYTSDQPWPDPFFGFLSAIVLLATAFPILRKSFRDILHSEAPVELQQQVVDTVMKTDSRIRGIHALRSREFGPYLYVDFHLKLSKDMPLREAHAISDQIEGSLKACIPHVDVLIHIDPDDEADQIPWNPSYKLPNKKSD